MPFIFGPPAYNTNQVFYARMTANIFSKELLFQALFHLLWFPGYFGFNWDALYDSLMNLEGIKEEVVVLVHAGLPKLPDDDLRIYLTVLRDVVLSRRPDDLHRLVVVFDVADQDKVLSVLS